MGTVEPPSQSKDRSSWYVVTCTHYFTYMHHAYTHVALFPGCPHACCRPTYHLASPLHAVPGQVTDLLVSDSFTTSLTVTWNTPTVFSGPISMYKVCVYLYVCVHILLKCMYTNMVQCVVLVYGWFDHGLDSREQQYYSATQPYRTIGQ